MGKNFLVLGDAHMPWMSKRVFTKILDFLQQDGSKFDYVVQVGDLYDMFSHGRWARSYDLITPKQEMTEARLMAEEFWQILQSRCPKASHYQILGNHDARPMKKILEKAPEIAALLDIDHLWKFPGVNTVTDSREELILENIAFMHGFRSKLGDHAKYNQMCTVTGHSHRGGVV